jgi:transcriptional regulator with XRE-family HTH domain
LTTPTAAKGIRDGEDFERDIWIANAVGEVIASTPYLSIEPSGENIAQMLKACQTSVVDGKSIDLVQKIGRSKSSVSEWLQGKHIPHVDIILDICHIFDISLLQFLTGDTAAIARSGEPTPKTRQDSRRPRLDRDEEYFHNVRQQLQAIVDSGEAIALAQITEKIGHREKTLVKYFPSEWGILKSRVNKKIDKNKLRQVLEAELNSDEEPPPSMNEVKRRVTQKLGYNERCSRLYFPDICRAISKRYTDYRSVQNQRKIQQQCEEVRRLTRLIHEQGLYPSTRRLGEYGFAGIQMKDSAIRASY